MSLVPSEEITEETATELNDQLRRLVGMQAQKKDAENATADSRGCPSRGWGILVLCIWEFGFKMSKSLYVGAENTHI